MNIKILMQVIESNTDLNIQFNNENEYTISGEKLTVRDGIIHIAGTVLRVTDPKQFLYELRSDRYLRIGNAEINSLLKEYHKQERIINKHY